MAAAASLSQYIPPPAAHSSNHRPSQQFDLEFEKELSEELFDFVIVPLQIGTGVPFSVPFAKQDSSKIVPQKKELVPGTIVLFPFLTHPCSGP